MWKAERFDGDDSKDPLQQMLDFVNTHRLRPGHFEFAIATDEQGEQYCVMLYSTEEAGKLETVAPAPSAAYQPRRPMPRETKRPGRFAPQQATTGEMRPERPRRGAGRPGFKPEFGRAGEESGMPWRGGGRPRAGGPTGGRRPGGGRPGGGRPGGGRPSGERPGGSGRPKSRGGPKRGR